MAKLAEENVLDYRRGGDTVDDFAQKYMAEITRIYQFLNNLRSHNTAGPEQIEPDSYQIIVEDNKLKIRNEANTEWITLMKVEQNGGFTSETFGKLTSGDGSSMPTTGVNTYDTYWDTAHGKMYMWLNGSWQLLLSLDVTDLTGYDTLITANDVVSTETVTHTPNKLVRTNANGVLPVDVLGNAGMIAGIRNEVNNLTDGQVLTYRAASNSWRNEPKGVVGAGASLIINDGETQLAEYSGDEHKEVDVGVTSGITAHNSNANAHADLLHLRKAETAYAVGDIAYSPLLPSWAYLECTVGGTTDSGDLPVPSSVVVGSTFTDGTVTWAIRKIENMGNYTKTINAPMFNKRDTITTSGTYTAPVTGWYKITVKGGGGGGGGSYINGGLLSVNGSGGEGGTTFAYEHMTSGDTATVIIGAGGNGGAAGWGAGGNGGDSSVTVNNNTYTGGGGKGGTETTNAGGTGTICGCPGVRGLNGNSYQEGTPGGGAGGGTVTTDAVNGGGGASGGVGGSTVAGKAGGDGYVWFEYFDSTLNP